VSFPLLRLRARQEQPEPVTEVNIIPVIDISLVLLVILFVTAPLLSVPSTPVDLPEAAASADKGDSVAITLTAAGALSVRAVDADWDSLGQALAEELRKKPESAVVLRVDRSVPYREVQRLMTAAQRAGARSISFGTEPRK
jgi:biopolymer transport protein ExbD